MQIITYILIVFILGYILTQVWQLWVLLNYKNKPNLSVKEWPQISIWIAARNEEQNIANCLKALSELDYPKEKLQIIVGNDQSTDNTKLIAESFTAQFSFIKVIDIVDNDSGLKAKARVMAQIDQHAIGDYYLITDADVEVKSTWAKQMILQMTEGKGVASGTTMVTGDGIWNEMQGVDWAYFMGLLNIISYSGVPATAVGNNMIISKEAYWKTGGYANIKFSITEDYKLYSEVCKQGYGWDNVMVPEVLAYSAGTKGFGELLHQRKRWLSGGKELPWYWWLLFVIFGSYYFVMPVLFFLIGYYAVIFVLIKWLLQLLQINKIYTHLGENPPGLIKHFVYELYLFLITVCTAFFFISPFKTVWKGRKY